MKIQLISILFALFAGISTTAEDLGGCNANLKSAVAAPFTGPELNQLLTRSFSMKESDKNIVVLVDLPKTPKEDNAKWAQRREMAKDWVKELQNEFLDKTTRLILYESVGAPNANLPQKAWLIHSPEDLPKSAADLEKSLQKNLSDELNGVDIVLAPTEFSATAPLKNLAKEKKFRGATLPGFNLDMKRGLDVNFPEVARRCNILKNLLDSSSMAYIKFKVIDRYTQKPANYKLNLDLFNRKSHVSAGFFPESGTVGNLPTGETYIVPYEGEIPGRASRTTGMLPVQHGKEIVLYRVVENRAVSVISAGDRSKLERQKLKEEPAYGNIAELGLGVLSDLGVKPLVGEDIYENMLLNEKLGPHAAFGRSDHFGGITSPANFKVMKDGVHLDHVYIPELQPAISIVSIDLEDSRGNKTRLMTDGHYAPEIFQK